MIASSIFQEREEGGAHKGNLRYKRVFSAAFPSAALDCKLLAPASVCSSDAARQEPVEKLLHKTVSQGELYRIDGVATGAGEAASTPWSLGVSEGLDFCRDGEALLYQLQQRISAVGDQLLSAGDPAENLRDGGGSCCDKDGVQNGGLAENRRQQRLLEDEINECLAELRQLRGLLLALRSVIAGNSLLNEASRASSEGASKNREQVRSARSEAVSKAVKLFKLPQIINASAAAPAAAMAAVLRGVKRVVSAVADRVHNVESSASVWLTHGLEVLPYLQHLQQSLLDLTKQQQETAEKKQQVISRIAQKRLQAKEVCFRLEKTRDEFRLARIDLTREELEKVSGQERMRLLESKREALDRELKSLAAFSPLFVVERAAKYITLQYRPENSSVDYEISLEGLDLSFSRGVTRISPFFAVHVQPPNSRVRLLLEGGIGDLLQRLSAKFTSVEAPEQQGEEREGGLEEREGGMHAADDVVVEYIAAILIKTLSSSFTAQSASKRCLPHKLACQTAA